MAEYPNFCPRNDAGHEPAMPRVFPGIDRYFPVLMNPTVKNEDGEVIHDDGTVWFPCKHCGLVFWEPLNVAEAKAKEERNG